MEGDYEVICPKCKSVMSNNMRNFKCLNCGVTLTTKQASKQKNRRQSVAGQKLDKLMKDGRITL